mgnify:CR=1 FL=1
MGRVSADTGPCQTVGDADGVGAVEELGLDHAGSQQLFEAGAGDRDILRLAGSNFPGALAQDAGDGALQIADAGLAGVAVDDAVEGALGEGDLAGQTAGLELLGQQMLAGNVVFFHAGVAGQLDDVHAVAQRAGDGAEVVGRGDKEHMAQIERDIDEMIVEGAVLLRVQRFQQSCRRVAPEVACQLVDLVQQHQRVGGLGGDHGADDLAGHGTDVGAAVPADFSFIMDTAQRNTGEFFVQRTGNRAGKAGLTDTGRSHKANDRRLCFRSKDADSKVLKDTFFNFCKAVMVFIQKFRCFFQIERVFAFFFPRQGKYPFQIVSRHGSFCHHGRHGG